MNNSIPVFKPVIREEEINAASQSLKEGWLGMGRSVGEFEKAVADFLGLDEGRFAVALNTGHAALHLGFLLAGVGPGDEVITPAFNNIADFQAILATGATPVFCDIDDNTLCLDIQKAEELMSPKTKAIVVMDYDCCLCDHAAIAVFADKHGIRVMHDAAHSFGSSYNGMPVGTFSDICMFSFDPVKTLTCIDGGMLIVRSQYERDQLHEMRLIGMGQPSDVMYQNARAWTYGVKQLGFRYHMANLHAAIGLAQLKRIEAVSESRRAACQKYNKGLRPLKAVRTPNTSFEDVTPFLYYIRVPVDLRDQLRSVLRESGIDTGIHWQPGHWFELFKDCRRGDLSVTDNVANEILSLPLHSLMDTNDLERVIVAITNFFDRVSSNAI